MSLPAEVVTADHALEQAAEKADGQLAKHRWGWTLDESNPNRVSIREYARQVGRTEGPIRVMVNGYATWLDENMCAPGDAPTDLQEHVNRARMGSETSAAAEAVAKTRGGMSPRTAQQNRPAEVRRVRDMARERAEKHGTSVEDEAQKVAEQIKKQEEADTSLARERQARLGLRYVKVEGILAAMYRRGQDALTEMRDVPWEDEQRELLANSLANIKALLSLIDVALTGAAEVDWDAEMAKLS